MVLKEEFTRILLLICDLSNEALTNLNNIFTSIGMDIAESAVKIAQDDNRTTVTAGGISPHHYRKNTFFVHKKVIPKTSKLNKARES